MIPIPVSAAEKISKDYGYDQVVIVARKVGADGGEHCTTYGRNQEHCAVAARCGDFLKFKVMGWTKDSDTAAPAHFIDADALSAAIHEKLFPNAGRYTSQPNSRRIIADLIRTHLGQKEGVAIARMNSIHELLRLPLEAGDVVELFQAADDVIYRFKYLGRA